MNTVLQWFKKWLPLHKHILAIAICVLFYLFTDWCGKHRAGYFQQWLSMRDFTGIWILCVVLVYLNAWGPAMGAAIGHIIGIPVGQSIGDSIDRYYATLITPDMTAEELHAYGPRHAYVFFYTILIAAAVGALLQVVIYCIKKHRRKKKESFAQTAVRNISL